MLIPTDIFGGILIGIFSTMMIGMRNNEYSKKTIL